MAIDPKLDPTAELIEHLKREAFTPNPFTRRRPTLDAHMREFGPGDATAASFKLDEETLRSDEFRVRDEMIKDAVRRQVHEITRQREEAMLRAFHGTQTSTLGPEHLRAAFEAFRKNDEWAARERETAARQPYDLELKAVEINSQDVPKGPPRRP